MTQVLRRVSAAASAPWRRLVPLITVLPAVGLLLSGLITWVNLGWTDDFVARWLHSFAMALPVMPLGLLLMVALDRALSPRQLERLSPLAAKLLLALLTTVVMELLMSTVVTLANRGAGDGLGGAWTAAFVKSLPFGLLVGLAMAFLVKPRLDRWVRAA